MPASLPHWRTNADHALDVNELERDFVTESREASEKETEARQAHQPAPARSARRRRCPARRRCCRRYFALVQRSEARDAETAQFVQRLGAQALVEDDLDLSLLLARQAVAIDDSPQTRGYLLATLRSRPAIGIMHGDGDVLRGIDVSPDGKTVAVLTGGGGVLFFDVRRYAQSGDPLPAGGERFGDGRLAFSPDGRTLAVGGDELVRLIDARTHGQLADAAVGGTAGRVAFTKDGSRLVVLVGPGDSQALGDVDAQITVRDAATLQPIGRPIEPDSFVGAYVGVWYASPQFALAPGDRFLVTASEDGELALWDLRTRTKTRTWRIENGLAPALAVSLDGLTVAVGVKRGVQLVDLRWDGSERQRVTPLGARAGCSSAPTGRRSWRRTATRRWLAGTSRRRHRARRFVAIRTSFSSRSSVPTGGRSTR